MDIIKAPSVDAGAARGSPALPLQQQATPPPAAAMLDRVDIQPLDLIGALLILIAEVRAGLPPAALLPSGVPLSQEGSPFAGPTATVGQASGLAAPLLMRLFLQALPEEQTPDAPDDAQNSSAWAAETTQRETALVDAMNKGVAAVTAWRDVSPSVVAGVEETRAVVLGVLATDNVYAAWLLRPEWLGLAPRLERYCRRRRRALSNPDHEPERRHNAADERDSS